MHVMSCNAMRDRSGKRGGGGVPEQRLFDFPPRG